MRKKVPKVNIFLQARSNSKRLPYKSLIKINQIPLVVLCAKRLSGKGVNVTVLTSEKKKDDYLVDILKQNKINFFRGSLENVYERFLDCAKKLDNNDIIVRATADNPFVNYSFVINTLKIFLKNKEIYRGIDHKRHNLPYGMSIEIFRKSLILKYKKKLDKKTIEHVTPNFYKYSNKNIVKKNKLLKDFSRLSCTVDTFEDYKKINYVFKRYKDPTKVCWKKLVYKLKSLKNNKDVNLKKTKFIIGGAQIGSKYSNFKELDIGEIFKKKITKENFTMIDTAQNYSNSHKKISQIKSKKKINIITKLNYLISSRPKYYTENFYLNFYKILITLNTNQIETLLIHRFSDFKKNYSEILKIFMKLKSLKLIKNYGVSIYQPKELLFLMKNFSKLVIQFPINFVDYRWFAIDIFKLKKKSKSILIGRSVFLRGKLLKKEGYIKEKKVNNILKKQIKIIKKKYNIKSNLELCIRYVNSLNFLNYIVFGIEDFGQIKKIIKYKNKQFSNRVARKINQMFEFLDTKYIDILKL